jgi:DNA-binding response OmpR family regulator
MGTAVEAKRVVLIRENEMLPTCTARCRGVWVLNPKSRALEARGVHWALDHEDAGAVHGWAPHGRAEHAGVVVDLDEHRVTVDGAEVRLTAVELRVLAVLVHWRGRPVPAETLVERVWGESFAESGRVTKRGYTTNGHLARVNVARVRGKIGARRIETVHGVGWRLAEPRP